MALTTLVLPFSPGSKMDPDKLTISHCYKVTALKMTEIAPTIFNLVTNTKGVGVISPHLVLFTSGMLLLIITELEFLAVIDFFMDTWNSNGATFFGQTSSVGAHVQKCCL